MVEQTAGKTENMKIGKIWKIIITILVVLIVVDLVYLNYQFIITKTTTNIQNQSVMSNTPIVNKFETQDMNSNQINISDIYWAIKEATSSITQKIDELSLHRPTVQTNATNQTVGSSVKEYYIPLGYGSTSASDWVDIPGVEAYVAPSNYGQIKEIYFEAGIKTVNGRGYVRLKNITDNNPLFESEVYKDGPDGGLVSSGKLPLSSATKLYRVQMKSSMGSDVFLENARIKIFAQ